MPDLITKILQRGGEVTWIIFALGTFALIIVIGVTVTMIQFLIMLAGHCRLLTAQD